MPNENKLVVRNRVIVCVIVAVMGMMLFLVNDPYGLKLVLLLACIIWVKPFAFLNRTGIDRIVFLLWVYDIILCFTSINTFASVRVVRNSTTLYFAYLLLRQVMEYPRSVRFLRQSICIVMGVALLLSLLSFFIFRRSVLEAGFEDTYSFRFLFLPLGYNTNEWTTVLLCFVGLALVYQHSGKAAGRRLASVLLVLSWAAVWLSFSRGAFIVSGFFMLLLLGFLRSIKEKWKLLVVVSLSIGAVSLYCPKEVVTALSMNRTVSQRHSTQSRINATRSACKVSLQRVWFGAGTGNYTLAMDKELNQDSTLAYTTFAPNWVVQTLIEKGIIGLGLSIWLLVCIAVQLWKGRRNCVCAMAGCTLCILVLKEMTLSTLLSAPVSILLTYMLLVYMHQGNKLSLQQENIFWKSQIIYGAVMVCTLCCIGCEFYIIRRLLNEKKHEKAIQTVPHFINEGILCMNRFKDTSKKEYLEQADKALSRAQKQQQEDVYIDYLLAELDLLKGQEESAYITLEKLEKLYPRNVLYQYRLYKLLYDKGKKTEAARHLEEAILLSPRMLGMEHVRMLEKADSCFYHHLLSDLLSRHPVDMNSPSDLARYGFIAFFCGKMNESERYLSQSVAKMPNLSTPWLLLGEIKQKKGDNKVAELCLRKYKLLTYGAFTHSIELVKNDLEQMSFQEKDLFRNYSMKFREWYGCELITLQ